MAIWGLSAYVRANGWKNKNKLKIWSGVLASNLIGAALLFLSNDL